MTNKKNEDDAFDVEAAALTGELSSNIAQQLLKSWLGEAPLPLILYLPPTMQSFSRVLTLCPNCLLGFSFRWRQSVQTYVWACSQSALSFQSPGRGKGCHAAGPPSHRD
jgi:hypothetical protein